MRAFFTAFLFLLSAVGASAFEANAAAKPTIVLVHGAFAESSSWNSVIERLSGQGFHVVAAGNPLRGVKTDAAAISALARSIPGDVILVGHSYGGPVITEAANDAPNVKSLVYVAGFAPDTGESANVLAQKFPGSTLGKALQPVALQGGGQDLYIRPDVFHEQFAADLPAAEAALMAATQRPVTLAALSEAAGAPAWKRLPSYMIYGSADRNIPAAVMKFMAARAHAKKTVVIDGASHAVMASHPEEVAAFIAGAASAR
ncbi:alpha/beta hydrolase [Terrihabitans soli]|uniref:Alpha/beta hydrolase n=1 Tax=Terrihabitans soli TaxID=708113 RepID=A0A6S6QMF0_9HYPH|nr:alpha/beta hydrolase [Terrihabitans soli]BCJ90546.1 alpha/beta hydrolase [Terrihabitans soli]